MHTYSVLADAGVDNRKIRTVLDELGYPPSKTTADSMRSLKQRRKTAKQRHDATAPKRP